MREFWMRLMSVVVIVGLILGYNSVLEVRAKDEEIAKLNAKIENTESLEDEDSKNGSYKDGTYTGEADGFGGTVKVEVIVKKQKIKEVNIVSADGERYYTEDSGCAKCRSRYDQWCDFQFYRNQECDKTGIRKGGKINECKTIEKDTYMDKGNHPIAVFYLYSVGIHGSICRCEIYIYTDWCR